MNLASAWNFAIILMCENNQFGEYARIPDYAANPDFAGGAAVNGFRDVKVDGNDPTSFTRR